LRYSGNRAHRNHAGGRGARPGRRLWRRPSARGAVTSHRRRRWARGAHSFGAGGGAPAISTERPRGGRGGQLARVLVKRNHLIDRAAAQNQKCWSMPESKKPINFSGQSLSPVNHARWVLPSCRPKSPPGYLDNFNLGGRFRGGGRVCRLCWLIVASIDPSRRCGYSIRAPRSA
jgi:hypothetical protein